jgi:formate-dependent nitrite reductase membrane component NrfD
VRQAVWGRLAVSNFFLGGTGAGVYVLAVLLVAQPGAGSPAVFGIIQVLAPALVLAGFLSVGLEAGRPWRGFRVLTNLRGSWMSRELFAGLLFVLLALSHTLWPQALLNACAALAALALLVSQGLLLRWARGIPAWNQWRLPVLFVVSGFLTGAALLLGLALLTQMDGGGSQRLGAMLGGLTLVSLGLWCAYLRQPPTNTALQHALRRLSSRWQQGSIVGIGHVLPLVLLGSGVYPSPASPFLLLAACVALLLGGWWLKDGLVTQAGYLIGLPIPRLSSSSPPTSKRNTPPCNDMGEVKSV